MSLRHDIEWSLVVIDGDLLTAARDLCADAGYHNPEYVRGCAELIIDVTRGLNQDEHKDTLIEFLGAPLVDPDAPMTDDQRRALFAGFREAFGDEAARDRRMKFTRAVLGEDRSWSRGGPFKSSLTVAQASRLLDVLKTINDLGV